MIRHWPHPPFLVAWAVLIVLLAISVVASALTEGALLRAVTAGVAATQAAIILAVFMKLRERPGLSWVFAGAGFFWLAILVGLSATDYLTRAGWPP